MSEYLIGYDDWRQTPDTNRAEEYAQEKLDNMTDEEVIFDVSEECEKIENAEKAREILFHKLVAQYYSLL